MRRFRLWLLQRSRTRKFMINFLICSLIILFFHDKLIELIYGNSAFQYTYYDLKYDSHILKWEIDLIQSILYFFSTIWLLHNTFFKLDFNPFTDELTIIKAEISTSEKVIRKLVGIALLISLCTNHLIKLGIAGVIIGTGLLLVIGGCCSVLFFKKFQRTSFINEMNQVGKFIYSTIIIFIIGFIYFTQVKNAFCYEFGVEEIGHYFEKGNYTANYYVRLRSVDDFTESELLPAQISVSKAFVVDGGTVETSDYIRLYVIVNVELDNGNILEFNHCSVPLDDEFNNVNACADQSGKEWYIYLTKQKVPNL